MVVWWCFRANGKLQETGLFCSFRECGNVFFCLAGVELRDILLQNVSDVILCDTRNTLERFAEDAAQELLCGSLPACGEISNVVLHAVSW